MSTTRRLVQILLCLIISFSLLVITSGLPTSAEVGSISLTLDDKDASFSGYSNGGFISSYFVYLDNPDPNYHLCAIDTELSTESSNNGIIRIYDHSLNLLSEAILGGDGFLNYTQTLYPKRSLADIADFQFLIQIDNSANQNRLDYSFQFEGHASTTLQGYTRYDTSSVIPNASVEINCLNSGEKIYVTSDNEGQYIATRCPVDILEISVQHQGTWDTIYPLYDISECSACEQDLTEKDLITTFQPPEIISTPAMPDGPSEGEAGQALTYSTGDASSNIGHSIEYRFDWGDGTRSNWAASTSASYSWSSSGSYDVRSQARCIAHPYIMSSWSEPKSITINLPDEEVVTAPNKPSGPSNSEAGQFLTYSTGGAFSNLGHALHYQFDWGDGTQSEWSPSSATSHSWSISGTYNIKVRARCATHTNIISNWSEPKTVTIHLPPEAVNTPNTPVGPSTGQAEQSLSFSTGGSFSNLGHSVQYRFDWGDGTRSEWSSSTTASHSWSTEGPRNIRAQARCATHVSVVSGWSSATTVTISPPPEAITVPNIPSGPASGEFSRELNYTTGGSTSNLGHSLQYRFDWGDGTQSKWSSSPSASYIWYSTGTYEVKAQARCASHTDIVSAWSEAKTVTINTPPEQISTPNAPTGPFSGEIGQNLTFTCGGASSNLGHSLQYRFDWGDGTQSDWSTSATASQSWSDSGSYTIKVQARCTAHTSVLSEWSESKIITILPPPEMVSTTNIPTGSSSGEVAEVLTFSVDGASSNLGNDLEYRFDWGDGSQSPWSRFNSASYAWSGEGPYNIRAQARSVVDPNIVSNWSGIKIVTINPPAETISAPNKPTGSSNGKMEQSLTYSTGGASSSYGHSLQYRFDWGDGTQSDWSSLTTASHYWNRPGAFDVTAQARCATHLNIVSEVSPAKTVTIDPSPESITTPNQPSGPSDGATNESLTFTTGGALSNLGHILQYRFDWGDRIQSEWTSSTSAMHTWTSAGIFSIKAQARCASHPSVVSAWSTGKTLQILSPDSETDAGVVGNTSKQINLGKTPMEHMNPVMMLQNTEATDSEGTLLTSIQLQPVQQLPPLPGGRYRAGEVVQIDPAEAIFQPPIIVKLKYNPALDINGEEVSLDNQENIKIARYDADTDQWIDFETATNAKSLTATTQTTQGGLYTVLYEDVRASMAWAITGAIILSIVALALIVFLVITRKEELLIAGQLVKNRLGEVLKRPPQEPPSYN